ncbi:uncharacterized protein LOC141649650 [Silene latifolia]|uniref:uncharacterized protein LOC141649650 n=1 Tax=Silene latifolia TaxID=37657 RepID=UPI003D77556D
MKKLRPMRPPKHLKTEGKSTVDELKELNLGTTEDPRPIYVSALLTKEDEEEYYKLLVEYKDVFAWSYKEMSGLNPKVAVHRLAIKKGTNPKKKSQRRFRSELVPEIEKEVNKLIEAGFIREVKYPTWIANIVPVRKKNGQLCICVDFRDRNDACPKDDIPLPVAELMIDVTTSQEALSFMDCAAGYNQIHMAPEDQEGTVVKGQALADFFADQPVPAEWEISDDLPGEEILYVDVLPPWQMYFDGVVRQHGAGAGVVFETPQNHLMPYSFTLTQLCSNNMAEYQALILGLQMAIEAGGQPSPWSANNLADALANLAATLALGAEESMQVPVFNRWLVSLLEGEENVDTTNMICVYTVDEDDCRQPIIDFLDHQKLPDDHRHKVEIRRRAPKFIHYNGTLYRRSFSCQWLRCLSKDEATEAMHEAHSGIFGAHQSGPKLHDRVKIMGYYWPTIVQDCMDFAKKCEPCQFYANFIHQPPEPLHPTVSSWPFETWGLDVVGPLSPRTSNGQEYILTAIDYFSKWAEAITLREVKKEYGLDFIRTQIIYRYGVPQRITTDNGKQFFNHLMTSLGENFEFKQYKSSMYNASANGLAEVFNKTLCNLLRKVVAKSKRDWHERIGEALWAYHTTYKTPTQATPYALVYGVEAVLPLELQIPSLRIAFQEGLTDDENDKLRLAELEALNEKRLEAQQKLQRYQARLSRAFNKKEVYTNGAYKIVDEDGVRVGPINGKFLKRYYS